MAAEFYSRPSLNVDTYDSQASMPVLEGDVAFYRELAAAAGGPVLDIGGGTGRVAWPLAEDGHAVTLLDLSSAMIDAARAKAAAASDAARTRVTFVTDDMRSFSLPEQFGLVIAPGRVFQMLLTTSDQRACLDAIHRHLRPGGTVVLELFDPRLDLCTPFDGEPADPARGRHRLPTSGHEVVVSVTRRAVDPLAQVFTELWAFEELGAGGEVIRRDEETLRMRWSYRYEVRYLLELAGFVVEAEYSDFHRSAPAYAAEQVWVARRAT